MAGAAISWLSCGRTRSRADLSLSATSSSEEEAEGGLADEYEGAPLPRYHALHAVDEVEGEQALKLLRKDLKNSYSGPEVSDIHVRGPGYMKGGAVVNRKLKVPSETPLYGIAGVAVFRSKSSLEHVAGKVRSLKEYLEQRQTAPDAAAELELDADMPPFLVMTFLFRSMWSGENTAVCHVFRRNDKVVMAAGEGARTALREFFAGDHKQMMDRLKFIAKVRDASASLRKTVLALGGERPVLIAKKLRTKFHRGANYVEVGMDVGSSTMASMLHGTVVKTSAQMRIDLSWLVEALHEDQLPEQIMAVVRWNYTHLSDVCMDLDREYRPKVRKGAAPAAKTAPMPTSEK